MANPRRRRSHRRTRRNFMVPGSVLNPRRRHHRRRRHLSNPRRRRHHFRRNPQLFGFEFQIQDVGFVAAGLVVPPIVTNYVWNSGMIPAGYQNSKAAYYAVQAGVTIGVPLLVRRFVSRRAGNLMLLGGAASLAISLINAYVPSLLPGASMPTGLSGMGYQPMLGDMGKYLNGRGGRGGGGRGMGFYETVPSVNPSQRRRLAGMLSSPMIDNAPDRLNPAGRF